MDGSIWINFATFELISRKLQYVFSTILWRSQRSFFKNHSYLIKWKAKGTTYLSGNLSMQNPGTSEACQFTTVISINIVILQWLSHTPGDRWWTLARSHFMTSNTTLRNTFLRLLYNAFVLIFRGWHTLFRPHLQLLVFLTLTAIPQMFGSY